MLSFGGGGVFVVFSGGGVGGVGIEIRFGMFINGVVG